jgi:translation initiation factor 2 alpha subunit (eIF-2alpha)
MVLRVDKEKGYIDLSKRRVSPEDIAAAEEKFNKSKMVHSIMRHTAETTGSEVREAERILAHRVQMAQDELVRRILAPTGWYIHGRLLM